MPVQRKVFRIEEGSRAAAGDGDGALRHREFMTEIRALRQMIDKDRAATDAKTARLKALRLAQEKSEPQPAAPKPHAKKAR